MKHNIFKLIGVLTWALLLSACQQNEYLTPDKTKIPKAADIAVTVDVTYDENFLSTVAFNYSAPLGTSPAFIFSSSDVVTKSQFTRTYKIAGTYSVEVKAFNSHGISEGSQMVEFIIPYDYIAPYDPSDDVRLLSGGSSKTWVMDAATDGHFGCGESGGDGLNWWSASAHNKDGWSLYDNTLTFNSDMTYTFDPVDGMIYVNTGSGYEPSYNLNDGNDYIAPAEVQNTTYSLEMDGSIYLKFPANTLIGYVPHMDAVTNPTYRILTLTSSVLEFVVDNGSIAWHFRFIPLDPNAGLSDEDKLTGGSSKTWKWAYASKGHLACGEPNSDGTNWWSAAPMEKANFGLYDDLLTFNADGTFVMDPGAGGTVYVNTGSGVGSEYNTNDGADYQVPYEKTVSSWGLSTEGGVSYLTCPPQTIVGYVPNPEAYSNPKYKILNITGDLLELVIDNGGIAWHYLFVPENYEGDELSAAQYASSLLGSWTWEPSVNGHFGCGTSGGNGLDWWSAGANEKEGLGLYDDILTFGSDNSYTFDPGVGGTVYVNWECGFHSELWDGVANSDYQVPVEVQTTTYTFDESVITWPANTFVSYVPNAGTLTAPSYRIVKMTPYIMELVTDNGSIAWHYRFKRYAN